ncbi:MAG: ATP-binding protein, partial [Candidatus Deferrimicrobiaceae bacterium]
TGPGISEENLPHIFEPFFTTKEEGKGTGLGLSLAYRIVENHEGQIRAECRPEKGTTFSIILPIGTQENRGDASED